MVGAVRHDSPAAGQKRVLVLGKADVSDPENHEGHSQRILASDHGGQRPGVRNGLP